MFNPNTQINPKDIWTLLGTFYNYVDPDSKENIEKYWLYLANGVEGLYYNLAQASLSNNLLQSPGYIEHGYKELEMYFEDLEIERFEIPTNLTAAPNVNSSNRVLYSYTITAFDDYGETEIAKPVLIYSGGSNLGSNNNHIAWTKVTGVNGYRIYGRTPNNMQLLANVNGENTTTYSDTGGALLGGSLPNENTTLKSYVYKFNDLHDYLSIPTLSGVFSQQVLYEDIDYVLSGLHSIRFLSPSSIEFSNDMVIEKETYFYKQGISLIPILTNFYFKAFGEVLDPEVILRNNYYTPYVNGYLDNTLNTFEKQKAYALHLTRWSGAIINRLLKGPTLKNLREALSLFYNVPFAYEAGVIANIYTSGAYKYITIVDSTRVYQIPAALTITKNIGNSIEAYELLCQGVSVYDYISSPALISGMTNWGTAPHEYYCTLAYEVPAAVQSLNYYNKLSMEINDNYLRYSIFPPSLVIKRV